MDKLTESARSALQALPGVDKLLKAIELKESAQLYSLSFVTDVTREELGRIREEIIASVGPQPYDPPEGQIIERILTRITSETTSGLRRVVNATGTLLHTNLGRAVLSASAREALQLSAGSVNVEYDLQSAQRGERDNLVAGLIKRLTGAQDACVVNNNAAAVLITLNTLADGREVVISRGELVEIGASFRLPDIISKSGCILKEVGTTNKTNFSDFANAIRPIRPGSNSTALILKAHTSNYKVVGFTEAVSLSELAKLASQRGVALVEDLGSGSLVDMSSYAGCGSIREPTVSESIKAGVDVVTFSGDKLLGGPQAGIIAGKKSLIDRIRKNPLKRALRLDKLRLAALEATLMIYLNPESLPVQLPTLRFLTRRVEDINATALEAVRLMSAKLQDGYNIRVVDAYSEVGSGSLPCESLPTKCIEITHECLKPGAIAQRFMDASPPVMGRIKNNRFLLDMRTIEDPADVVPQEV